MKHWTKEKIKASITNVKNQNSVIMVSTNLILYEEAGVEFKENITQDINLIFLYWIL